MDIIISRINTLQEAVKYHNEILEQNNAVLDFSNASFIRNNYLSIIGLALEKLKFEGGNFEIILPRNKRVLKSMRDIEFLDKFCDIVKGSDNYKTMIKYTNIKSDSDIEFFKFYKYFQKNLLDRVQNISPKLANKIMQKIFELFSNVFRHSQSELGLFCSGQFYPSNDKFNFTIVDGGVGIKNNVNRYLKQEFEKRKSFLSRKKYNEKDAKECIKWAVQEGHSTTGKGGLGLALLLELIQKSNGKLEIISDNGMYSIKNDTIRLKELNEKFNGTIISIELDTDASKFYYLQGEQI